MFILRLNYRPSSKRIPLDRGPGFLNFVRSIAPLLINIERQKFHKSEIISWRRHVANFVHVGYTNISGSYVVT